MSKQILELDDIGKEYSINDMKGIYIFNGVGTLNGYYDNKGNKSEKSEFYIFSGKDIWDKKKNIILQVNIYKDYPITIEGNHITVPEEKKIISHTGLKTKSSNPIEPVEFWRELERGKK